MLSLGNSTGKLLLPINPVLVSISLPLLIHKLWLYFNWYRYNITIFLEDTLLHSKQNYRPRSLYEQNKKLEQSAYLKSYFKLKQDRNNVKTLQRYHCCSVSKGIMLRGTALNFLYFVKLTQELGILRTPLKHTYWLFKFLTLFIQRYTLNKVNWLIFSPQFLAPKGSSARFFRLYPIFLKTLKQKSIVRLFKHNISTLVYTLLFTKSLTIFNKWLINYLKTLQTRRYKRVLMAINIFLKHLIVFGQDFNLLQGFKLMFKGKLLGRGGTRKKKIIYRYGRYSIATKTLKFNSAKFIIRTSGGVIGGEFSLFFIYVNVCFFILSPLYFYFFLFFFIFYLNF